MKHTSLKHIYSIIICSSMLFVLMLINGCSLFEYIQRKAEQSNLTHHHWYIQQVIIQGEHFYAPQVLATYATWELAKQTQKNAPKPSALNGITTSQLATLKAAYKQAQLNDIANIQESATMHMDTKQGLITGRSGCGSYTARYVWNDPMHIELLDGTSLRKICSQNDITRFEFRLIRELEGSFTVIKQGSLLILEKKGVRIYLYAAPSLDASLSIKAS